MEIEGRNPLERKGKEDAIWIIEEWQQKESMATIVAAPVGVDTRMLVGKGEEFEQFPG